MATTIKAQTNPIALIRSLVCRDIAFIAAMIEFHSLESKESSPQGDISQHNAVHANIRETFHEFPAILLPAL
jgi:hypothetical protein